LISDVLTEAQVVAQSILFLIAGFETSSTLLTFTCYELAINQSIQVKLREEICSVLERYNGKCSYEAMQEMPLLDMVLMGMYHASCIDKTNQKIIIHICFVKKNNN
jgi:cytochrome P450